MNAQVPTVEQWGIFKLALEGPASGNPFKDVELSCEFAYQNRTLIPNGFYDGSGNYKVRFMPDQAGQWRYRTISNIPVLHDVRGTFTCISAQAGNHGPVGVRDTYHFG